MWNSRKRQPHTSNPIIPSCGLITLFSHQAVAYPNQLAYLDGDLKITYSQLYEKAKSFANEISKKWEIELEEPVGILTEKGIDHIIAQISVLFLGGTCLPLDPSLSDDQLQGRLLELGVRYIVADVHHQNRQLPTPQLCLSHSSLRPLKHSQDSFHPVSTLPSSRSHILFTSGSTGVAKAIGITASNIYRIRNWTGIEASDRVAHINSVTFDAGLIDMWATLLSGATIVNVRKSVLLDPLRFSKLLKDASISWMLITTALFNMLALSCPSAFATLDSVFTGGEAGNLKAMQLILENGPPGRLIHAYGPTEASMMATSHEVTLEDVRNAAHPVSIGRPINGTDAYVVDENLQPVVGTAVGELLLAGIDISPCYINRPELNEKLFVRVKGLEKGDKLTLVYRTGDLVRRRESGLLEYVARNDHQVKIRGYKFELGAVDKALVDTNLVATACTMKVQLPDNPEAGSFLLAYVTLKSGSGSEEVEQLEVIRQILKNTLQECMVPRLKCIDKFPLISHGKVDRKKLLEIYFASFKDADLGSVLKKPISNGEPNECSAITERLKRVWALTLGIPYTDIGLHDNYFSLGGTSLQTATLIFKIREGFGVNLTVAALYQHQTLSALATYIEQGATANLTDEKEQMLKDISLCDSLQPLDGPAPHWRSPSEGDIFVTGTTGFLGAFLLQALLQVPEVRVVRCLVRAKDAAHGLLRIQQNFAKYGITTMDLCKVVAVPGDLASPNLGLSQASFDDIAAKCSAIFHLGARIDYTQPYMYHRPPNVIGTLNILHLAVTGRVKVVHYSSSIAAYGPSGLIYGKKTFPEDISLKSNLDSILYDIGYSQSQWVAERMISQAIDKGVPVAIYRPGFILGHSETGCGNPDDFVGRLMVSCIQAGIYPLLPKQRKEIVPVDHVVKTIMHISSSAGSLGHAYNIVPFDNSASTSMNDTFEMINRCGTKIPRKLQGIPYEDWVQRIGQTEEDRLRPLLPMLQEVVYEGRSRWEMHENMPVYQTDNTRRAMVDSDLPQGCAPLNEKLLKSYLESWLQQKERR